MLVSLIELLLSFTLSWLATPCLFVTDNLAVSSPPFWFNRNYLNCPIAKISQALLEAERPRLGIQVYAVNALSLRLLR